MQTYGICSALSNCGGKVFKVFVFCNWNIMFLEEQRTLYVLWFMLHNCFESCLRCFPAALWSAVAFASPKYECHIWNQGWNIMMQYRWSLPRTLLTHLHGRFWVSFQSVHAQKPFTFVEFLLHCQHLVKRSHTGCALDCSWYPLVSILVGFPENAWEECSDSGVRLTGSWVMTAASPHGGDIYKVA